MAIRIEDLLRKFIPADLLEQQQAANARLAQLRLERRRLDVRLGVVDAEIPIRDGAIKAAQETLGAATGRRARGTGDEGAMSAAREAHAGAVTARDQARDEVTALRHNQAALEVEAGAAYRAAVMARERVIAATARNIIAAIQAEAMASTLVQLLVVVHECERDAGLGIIGRIIRENVIAEPFEEPDDSTYENMLAAVYRQIPQFAPPPAA